MLLFLFLFDAGKIIFRRGRIIDMAVICTGTSAKDKLFTVDRNDILFWCFSSSISSCFWSQCRGKWNRILDFKSWTRLLAFHIVLISLGKTGIEVFSFQLWIKKQTGLSPWYSNRSRRRKFSNSTPLNSALNRGQVWLNTYWIFIMSCSSRADWALLICHGSRCRRRKTLNSNQWLTCKRSGFSQITPVQNALLEWFPTTETWWRDNWMMEKNHLWTFFF